MSKPWYSDEALAKQAEAKRRTDAGEPIDTNLMLGILQARVAPSADQRCGCCGSDAREEVGGSGNHCGLCIGRGHDKGDS